MKKYYFICNPMSGAGQGKRVWKQIEQYLNDNNVPYEKFFSERHGHVAELVNHLMMDHWSEESPVNVILVGGDGTLDEALQGIDDFNKVNIGYVPTGSGNDFARSFGYSDDTVETVKHILSVETPRIIDLGKLEYRNTTEDRSMLHEGEVLSSHWFDVSCGIGFDAAICEKACRSKAKVLLNKIGMGKLVYVASAIKLIFTDVTPDAKIILDDDEEIEIKKLRFIVGMNTNYEGGGYKFAPGAAPDDGYLDVCHVSDISPLRILPVIPKAAAGTHVKNKKVHIYRVKNFEVKTKQPLWVHTDGEVYTKSSYIRVSVVPGILRLLY